MESSSQYYYLNHPMNGLIGIIMILLLLPLVGLYPALIVTLFFSIIALGFIYLKGCVVNHIHGIILGGATLVLFSIASIIINSRVYICPLSYQMILLGCFAPLAFYSVLFLRGKGRGLSRMQELCPKALTRELIINEHKRLNKCLLCVSIVMAIVISPLLIRSRLNPNCPIPTGEEQLMTTLVPLPFIILYIYEIIRLLLIRKELKKEVWIGLHDKNGQLTGRISQNHICHYDGPYMPCLIRVLICHHNEILLSGNSQNGYDTPVAHWLEYSQSKEALISKIQSTLGINHPEAKKILTYQRQFNKNIFALIQLYVIEITDKDSAILPCGKWWCTEDLSDEVNRQALSPIIAEELAYFREIHSPKKER